MHSHGCLQVINGLLKLKVYIKDIHAWRSYKRISEKSDKLFMDVKKKQKFYIDIYKTLNNLNPSFMKEISEKTYLRPLRKQYQLNLII